MIKEIKDHNNDDVSAIDNAPANLESAALSTETADVNNCVMVEN